MHAELSRWQSFEFLPGNVKYPFTKLIAATFCAKLYGSIERCILLSFFDQFIFCRTVHYAQPV